LTRTSVWFSKMKGGIDYLKEVVIHDTLGMAAEWEAEMQTFTAINASENTLLKRLKDAIVSVISLTRMKKTLR
jgi:NAD(P)H-nitrite reductase large subunit